MRQFFIKHGMTVFITVLMTAAGLGLACAMMDQPGPITVDCRGKNIEVETLRQWEKQERDGYLGLTGIAGWRVENQGQITSVSTGRSQTARVTGVYGPMELVYPADILSGTYGLAVADGYCVLTESLADQLFGNTDIAGELCQLNGTILTVAGVIDKKDMYLILPISEGRVEHLSLKFKSRRNVEKKVKDLLGSI